MADTRSKPPQDPPAQAPPGFRRGDAFRSIGFSLIVNALCPWLLYRLLEPRFPEASIAPLLYATIFPVLGFLVGVLRKQMADAIALIVLAGIVIHVAVTVLSPDVPTALILRSFEGAVIGLGFCVSVLFRRPIILFVARQFVAAGAPERRPRFDAAVAMDKGRAFAIATTVWGGALIVMSAVHVALAVRLPPAQFILVSPVLGMVTNVLLIGWSIRYTSRRLAVYIHPRT